METHASTGQMEISMYDRNYGDPGTMRVYFKACVFCILAVWSEAIVSSLVFSFFVSKDNGYSVDLL